MAYFSYESRELAEDSEPGAEDPEPLLPREGLAPDEAEAEADDATFCEDELLVNVLKAFIHLVFIPPPLPPLPLPPDIKLNLLPRLLSC